MSSPASNASTNGKHDIVGEATTEVLRRRRQVARRRYTNQLRRLHGLIDGSARTELLKVSFNYLSECKVTYQDAHEELELSSLDATTVEAETLELENDLDEYEACALAVASREADDRVAVAPPAASTSPQGSQQVNPFRSVFAFTPESLPKFDGNPLEFVAFWDRFKTEVHTNPELSNARKFGILASCLRGPPLEMTRGLSQTDANYEVVVDLLFNQYHDVRAIVEAHILGMLDLDSKPGTKDLRVFHDTCEAHVRALRALGRDVDIGVLDGGLPSCELIVPLLKRQLPETVLRKWELQMIKESADPSVARFLKFLKEEVRLNERMKLVATVAEERESVQRRPQKSKWKRDRRRYEQSQSEHEVTAAFAGSTLKYCPFCEKACHEKIEECKSINNLSLSVKLSTLMKYQLCFLCMISRHPRDECKSPGCGVADCKYSHHKLLHRFRKGDEETEVPRKEVKGNAAASLGRGTGILQTVQAELISPNGSFKATVLLDPGSDTTFISASLAERAGLEGKPQKVHLDTVGSKTQTVQSNFVTFSLAPIGEPKRAKAVSALTLRHVASIAGPRTVQANLFPYLQGLQFAPQPDNKAKSADVLLGADFYYDFLIPGQIVAGKAGEPAGIGTIFGWIIGGPNPADDNAHVYRIRTCHAYFGSSDMTAALEKFWRFEEGGISDALSTDRGKSAEKSSDKVHEAFKQSTQFIGDRYQVRLPWKDESEVMPNNFGVALECLQRSERKHRRNPAAMKAYDHAIQEYRNLDFAEAVPKDEILSGNPAYPNTRIWYLPHHAVIKEDRETTKVRIVFNGAVKYEGYSLNECLHTGPNLLPSIAGILLRFRCNAVAITADVKKMFLQISVAPQDRDALRYLWRDEEGNLLVLRFKSVIFGTNCSPFLAIATVHNHCELRIAIYPLAGSAIKRNMYMDDLASGAGTVEEANSLALDCRQLMLEGGFELTKWTSNEPDALQGIPENDQAGMMKKPLEDRVQKILGVRWKFKEDALGVQKDGIDQPRRLNKLSLLHDVASIFDPMGLVAPYATAGRILLQTCWKQKIGWNDDLPPEIEYKYLSWREELKEIQRVVVSRYLFHEPPLNSEDLELHGFGDASEKAYGSVVYLKYDTAKGVKVQLLLAKGRVAPIKPVTMPRLELTAAVLTAELLTFVQREIGLHVRPEKVFAWSDSEISLHWIVGDRSTDQFVKNRVEKIRALLGPEFWRHCAGTANPADDISRGTTLAKLVDSPQWINGPKWLHEVDVAKEPAFRSEAAAVVAAATSLVPSKPFEFMKYPFAEALNLTAIIRRFVENTRTKDKDSRRSGPITCKELGEAELFWMKQAQLEAYPNEVESLISGKTIAKQSSLIKLDPFLDKGGTLRVGGRITESNDSYAAKHPVVLPRGSDITTRIIERTHIRHLHVQPNHLLTILRQRYWIPKGRSSVKAVVHTCGPCRRYHSKPLEQKMGNLPEGRVNFAPPFEKCGVDFAGPLNYIVDIDTKETAKAYICLFVCMVTRAVHLELVTDLSVDKFLQALRRMSSRRGATKFLLSDNAKTFKAAQKILEKAVNTLTKEGITWQFIPERGPWAGGMYERLVRSIKTPLRKVIGASLLQFEELATVLCEVESHVNSRPLTGVTDSVTDFEVITPSHFLAGRQVSTADLFDATKVGSPKTNLRKRWKQMQQGAKNLKTRWQREYVRSLQERVKWQRPKRNLQQGDLVMIESEGQPRCLWQVGRVETTAVGRDGLIRSAMIKKADGKIFRRPVQRLYLLEESKE